MPKEEKRLAALERTARDHEQRLTALEAKLEPNRLSATALELLLQELNEQFGKEDA